MPNFDDLDKAKGKATEQYEDAYSRPASHDQPPSSTKLGRFPSRHNSPIQAAFNEDPRSAKTRDALAELERVRQELAPRFAGGGLVGQMSLVQQAADTFLRLVVGNWPRLYDQLSPWALTIQKWAYRQHLTEEEAKIAIKQVQVTLEEFETFLDDMRLPGDMKLPENVRAAISRAFAALYNAVKEDINHAQR